MFICIAAASYHGIFSRSSERVIQYAQPRKPRSNLRISHMIYIFYTCVYVCVCVHIMYNAYICVLARSRLPRSYLTDGLHIYIGGSLSLSSPFTLSYIYFVAFVSVHLPQYTPTLRNVLYRFANLSETLIFIFHIFSFFFQDTKSALVCIL